MDLISAADVEMRAPHGPQQWGPWTLNKRTKCLVIKPYPNKTSYEIALREITTLAEMVGWIDHISQKTWPTDPTTATWTNEEMVAGLVHALLYNVEWRGMLSTRRA